jgi:hypothetical protein
VARLPAWKALQPGSDLLEDLRADTTPFAIAQPHLASLRARTLWANPDGVVGRNDYEQDPAPFSQQGVDHSEVCKPTGKYAVPWTFVETGTK